MASLTIRKLDDAIRDALRLRAARSGRSVEDEVRVILREAAQESASAAPAFRVAILQTTTLMKHRLFTARGAATHLHMIVRVTDRLVNHGAFTIDAAGSFELRSGKHVSVTTVER